jgi:hypothetical protein
VDFAPDEEITHVRKALLRNHKATLGGYIFDGTLLFTSVRLPQDVSKFHIYFSSIISSEIMSLVLLASPLDLVSHLDDISLILFLFCHVVDKIQLYPAKRVFLFRDASLC